MRNVPTDFWEITHMIASRMSRRDSMLVGMGYPHTPRMLAGVMETVRSMLKAVTKRERAMLERKRAMEAQECTTFCGIGRLKAARELLGDNALFYRPNQRVVETEDADAIEDLYRETGLAAEQPGMMRHLVLTRAYAQAIAERLAMNIHAPVIAPHAVGAMGLLRNVAMFFGERGYHRKDLISAETCRQLCIDPHYIAYLRPPSVDSGPLRRSEYAKISAPALQERIRSRCDGILKILTPAQRVLEFAGMMAKTDDAGTPRTFEHILAHAEQTRRSREEYEAFTDEQSLFFSSRYATDTLSPEFEAGWMDIERAINQEFLSYGVDIEEVRAEIAAQHA